MHAVLVDGSRDVLINAFYSRWPLNHDDGNHHPEHGGKFEAATGAEYTTLDTLVERFCKTKNARSRVDMINVDVDGNELSVLKGAVRTLSSDRPVLLVEIAPHVQDEVAGRFEALLRLLGDLGYDLENASSGVALPLDTSELRRIIKFGASVDVVVRPSECIGPRHRGSPVGKNTLDQYLEIWNAKPVLRLVYNELFDRIVSACGLGPTLEIGAGIGKLKEQIPDVISSDIQFSPWLSLVADAQNLPFAEGTFGLSSASGWRKGPCNWSASLKRCLAGNLVFAC